MNTTLISASADQLAYVGANMFLATPEYKDGYAADLMEDAYHGLCQFSYQKREATFYKGQGRAAPKSDARQRTVEDTLFGVAVAEYEELQNDLGISDPEFMGETFLECIEDPCGVRDNFLSKAQRILGNFGYSEEKTRAEYAKAAKRVAEAHIEWAKPIKPIQSDPFALINKEVADLPAQAKDSQIEALIMRLLPKLDRNSKGALISALAAKTNITKPEVKAMVREGERNVKSSTSKDERTSNVPSVNRDDFSEQVKYGENRLLRQRPGGNPVVYEYEDDVCAIRNSQRVMLNLGQLGAVVNDYSEWGYVTAVGDTDVVRKVSAPDDVVKHLFNRADKPYARLREVKHAPHFVAGGFDEDGMPRDVRRIYKTGYDEQSETYTDIGELDMPPVSDNPSPEEVFEAKRLLIEETNGDYPLGGVKDRQERIDRSLHNKGEPIPAIANLVGFNLERAVRGLIKGPTPAWGFVKNEPGTGGSHMVETNVLAMTGEEIEFEDLPTTDEEFTKVKGTIANEGPEFAIFDNPNSMIDSGPFASLLTAPRIKARLLGSSRSVSAPVTHTTGVIANNLKGTPEILRRFVMVDLNARVADPKARSGWHHKDLKAWVRANRGKLVWAILTLVQNWIAKGMDPWSGYKGGSYKGAQKGSFENWSKVIGGILESAKIRGFLENDSDLMSYGSTSNDNGVQILVQRLARHDNGTACRPGGISEIRGHDGMVISVMAELNAADAGDPLPINGMGYSKIDNSYNHARLIKDKFREVARGTYRVTLEETPEGADEPQDMAYEITFTEKPDPKSKGLYYWVLNKRRID